MSAIRRAEVTWEGDLATGQGDVTAMSSALFSSLPVSWAARTEAPQGKTSPEELLAAAHASCFAMAFSAGLARAGTPPQRLEVSADVTFDKVGDGWQGGLQSPDRQRHRAGHQRCGLRRRRGCGEGRLPDQPGAQGQRRAERGRDARRVVSRRSSAGGAGSRPSSSRSRSSVTPGVAESRQERLREVGVAVALVAPELRVVADVLAQQDPVRVAAGEQLAEQLDRPRPRRSRSRARKVMPRKSNSTFAPRSMIAR